MNLQSWLADTNIENNFHIVDVLCFFRVYHIRPFCNYVIGLDVFFIVTVGFLFSLLLPLYSFISFFIEFGFVSRKNL